MLKDFVEAIAHQAVAASFPRLKKAEQEPEHVYYLMLSQDKCERVEAWPRPRKHQAGSLVSLTEMVKDLAGESPAIWYGRHGVSALLDSHTRRDVVLMPLTLHPQIVTSMSLEKSRQSFKQRDFVSFLRVNMAGTGAASLLEIVRRLKFKQGAEGESVVQHGKASLGRAIQTQLTGEGTIPEEFRLSLPVFDGPLATNRFPVVCAIEIIPEAEQFQLIPLPGEIERAICDAERLIGDRLVDLIGEAAAVYYGQP